MPWAVEGGFRPVVVNCAAGFNVIRLAVFAFSRMGCALQPSQLTKAVGKVFDEP